jgi:hypothetical protein
VATQKFTSRRGLWRLLFAAGALLVCLPPSAQIVGQNAPIQTAESSTSAISAQEAVDRAIASENRLFQMMRTVHPVVETYIQQMHYRAEREFYPTADHYFLGRLNVSNGVNENSFIPSPGFAKRSLKALADAFSMDFVGRGFAQMAIMDNGHLNKGHYDFQFVRREFLGDVRCLVYDVTPIKGTGSGHFIGRIWVEDQGYNVVRFNGTYGPTTTKTHYTHFDSWRVNCGPNLWLPAYAYAEETSVASGIAGPRISFKAQTRFWSYQSKREGQGQEFTNLTVDPAPEVNDKSERAADTSPIEATRLWQRQAEDNILDRLLDAGLIGPPGEVDKVVQTVVENLEISNNINIDPPVRVRVMLTTPFETVNVGHTILLSRGLIDVLPDEATLAAILAHELGHIMLGHQLNTKFAFSDRLFFRDDETLKRFRLARSEREDQAADEKAIELLKKSPYADQLPRAGLFLKMLAARSGELPHLIRPLIGDRLASNGKDVRLSALIGQSPALQVDRVDQISALPLGARAKMDPWSDSLYLMKAHNVPLLSAREKLPFEITPFMLHLTRENEGVVNSQPSSPR